MSRYLRALAVVDGTVKAFDANHTVYTVPEGKSAMVNFAELLLPAGGEASLRRITADGTFAPVYQFSGVIHKELGRFVLAAGDSLEFRSSAAGAIWLSIAED